MLDGTLIEEIDKRAKLFCQDNFANGDEKDFLIVQTAMIIGASIALELQANQLVKEMDALK